MRLLALFVLLLAAALGLAALRAVEMLESADLWTDAATMAALARGDVSVLVTAPGFASSFPRFDHPHALISLPAGLVMLGIGLVLFLAGRRWQDVPGAVWAILVILSAALPIVFGMQALRSNTNPPQAAGWLGFMVLGVVYASVLGVLFALLGLFARGRRQSATIRHAAKVRHAA